jgi:hypothetical protein
MEQSPEDFLKGKEAVEASYTVEATDQNGITFTLAGRPGICRWQNRARMRYDAAKAAFLEYLEGEVDKITVAEVVIDEEENITVTFNRDTTPSAVYQAANELVDALKGELDSSHPYT